MKDSRRGSASYHARQAGGAGRPRRTGSDSLREFAEAATKGLGGAPGLLAEEDAEIAAVVVTAELADFLNLEIGVEQQLAGAVQPALEHLFVGELCSSSRNRFSRTRRESIAARAISSTSVGR